MSQQEIQLDYDERTTSAVLTFADGKTLKLSNVSRDKAEAFRTRHAPEFAKRGLCLETPQVSLTRMGGSDG